MNLFFNLLYLHFLLLKLLLVLPFDSTLNFSTTSLILGLVILLALFFILFFIVSLIIYISLVISSCFNLFALLFLSFLLRLTAINSLCSFIHLLSRPKFILRRLHIPYLFILFLFAPNVLLPWRLCSIHVVPCLFVIFLSRDLGYCFFNHLNSFILLFVLNRIRSFFPSSFGSTFLFLAVFTVYFENLY